MRHLVRLRGAAAPAKGVCTLLLVLAASAGVARAQSFSLPIYRYIGSNPYAITVGDFNNDGKLDVATANAAGGSVTIALGNGDGTISSSNEYSTDPIASGVVVGDFNKDGKLDAAVANYRGGPTSAGSISVLFGNGDGSAQAAVNYNAGSPEGLAVADLNSDGNLDLVTASTTANQATVLLGNANGTFNAAAGYAVGTHPTGVTVADFNNDNKLDLATANIDGAGLSILIGNGDGTFQAASNVPTSPPLSRPLSLTAGDLNGDGKRDIVVTSPGDRTVGVLRGNGDGTFQSPNYYTLGGETLYPQLADFNGDGKLDVAVVNVAVTPGVAVLRGNGDGTLQAALNFPTQMNPWGLVATDFNKDGKPDLITTNQVIDRVNVLLNSPSARGTNFNATATLPASGAQVATFIDYDTTKTAASFTATINWGDGTSPSAGTVTANAGGGFDVTGTHTYALPALYSVIVQVADTSGNFASATATAAVVKRDQTIAFGPLSDKTYGDADFGVSATASSDLAVSFAASGGCTVTGSTVHITGAGSCTVTASQAGDAVYNAAPNVPQTFQVAKAATTTAVSTSASPSAVGQSVTFTAAVASAAGTPTGTVQFKVDGANAGPAAALNSGGVATFTTSGLSAGAHAVTAEYGGDSNFNASAGALAGGQVVGSLIEFGQSSYAVAEGGTLTVTVKRTGDTSRAAGVEYATDDGSTPSVAVPCSSTTGLALDRCDFTQALGTLSFAAGETEKTFKLLVGYDSYDEGPETLSLRLSNPSGGALGANGSATVTILDLHESAGNPIDDTTKFVTQHYRDFLNRDPDADGLAFWVGGIESCGADAQCREVKRIDTSAAFFLAIEFQEEGYLVERMYKAAYGDATSPGVPGTVPVVRFDEFLADTQRIGRGVIVNQGDWRQQLEVNQQAYGLEFVQRERFLAAFPLTMTAAEFVAKLEQNIGVVISTEERLDIVAALAVNPSDPLHRASTLRHMADNVTLRQRESNRAFVLMQFFGYLRRNPDDAPEKDLNFAGWRFWLDKLEEFGGDYRRAEMVKAFLSSDEYRRRFGQQ